MKAMKKKAVNFRAGLKEVKIDKYAMDEPEQKKEKEAEWAKK